MSLLALITARQVSIYEKYFVKICLLDLVVFIFLADNCQEVVQGYKLQYVLVLLSCFHFQKYNRVNTRVAKGVNCWDTRNQLDSLVSTTII